MTQSYLLPESKLTEDILSQARSWGFVCQQDLHGNWQILPQRSRERWKLHLVEDRWLLTIGEVPQVALHPPDVLGFLERRRARCSKINPAKPFH